MTNNKFAVVIVASVKKVDMIIEKFLRNPYMMFRQPSVQKMMRWLDDETYLKLVYRARTGKKLDLESPQSFNEKLQWLKLHDRNPLYTTLVDKYRVKEWVADKIGSQYVTETYDSWEKAGDIDISRLPERFVLKTNHDSGGVVICRDRESFDLEAAKTILNRSLRNNYYWSGREWPYKNVKPLIFAEEYLESADGIDDLPDYKLYHYNTGHIVTCVMTERFSENGYTATYFDEEWRRLDISDEGHETRPNIPRPARFDLMKELANRLAADIPFVRVDFYVLKSRLLFGEMTFYSSSGFESWNPPEWDDRFGSWIKLEGARSE